MEKFWNALTRRKRNDSTPSQLSRVLNLFDLTALGVGSTLGVGVYVLAGEVAYKTAGPAVVISFLMAAIASAFAGLCYAEFAARVPKAGSAYVYSYVTVGEFIAFTIGWNLILEYVIGSASVARSLTQYIDALCHGAMNNYFRSSMPININFLGAYPDFVAFLAVMLLTALLSFGVRESSILNNILTGINLTTIIITIVCGAINAKPSNWTIPKESIPPSVRNGEGGGEGGFLPFGINGVMAGAATCFYGFVGFDCVATTGEEAKNPQRDIPLAIVLSLIIIFLAYFGISTVLTMMLPYYLQDPTAPFPHAFDQIGWIEIKWIVTIGALIALCSCLMGALFPLPRVIYAMASDGIIFKKLKLINSRTQTPIIATFCSGLLAAIMALIFDVSQLIHMMSIGTLLAYSIVGVCVLILRYEVDDDESAAVAAIEMAATSNANYIQILKQIFNFNSIKHSNKLSSTIVKSSIAFYSICTLLFAALLKRFQEETANEFDLVAIIIVSAGMLLLILVIARQPVSSLKLTFRVPFVPYIPCLSLLFNIYLMFQLDRETWIRFAIWAFIGYLIYFIYGIRKSTEGNLQLKEKQLSEAEKESTNGFNNINRISLVPNDKSKQNQYAISTITKSRATPAQ